MESYKGRVLDRFKPVRVYKNLHKKKYSVMQEIDGKWRVIGHTDIIHLYGASFHVNEHGRQRVLKEKKKNVHAFVEGLIPTVMYECDSFSKIRYNPYETKFFMDKDGPVFEARWVTLDQTGIKRHDYLS